MRSQRFRPLSLKKLLVAAGLWWVTALAAAQFAPASPPIADPNDTRFEGVEEDWTTPALSGSHLRAVRPLSSPPADHSGYTTEMARVQWRFGDPIDLYVMRPKGVRKPPVILYLYGYPSDTDRFHDEDFQKSVTKDGFAAVGFASALNGYRYHDRPMRNWFVSELQESLATSAHDVQMVLDYLATRGDLDMNRVGMLAQGSGASIAILASAVDPRIKVLDTVNPWGDWPNWLAQSPMVPEEERPQYLKPEFLKKVADLDPVIWLPKIQANTFRLQEALFEVKTPQIAKKKLRLAVSTVPGRAATVIYKTPQDTEGMGGTKALEWLEQELRALDNGQQVSKK
jgi:hypothetical protein